MADQSPLDLLRLQGPDAWNSWRRENPSVRPIFTGADLSGVDLSGVDLSKADLSFAKLSGAHLSEADLSGADLFGADLSGANLIRARLFAANLAMANLEGSRLINCDIYGISAWDLLLSNDTQQSELLINASRRDGTTISFQVDDIEVAQFISLLRTSREPSRQIEKIRKVVDSLGLKAQEVARSLATAPDEASNGATVKPEEKEETVAEGQTDSEQNKARDVDEMKREMRRTIAGLPAQDRNNILTDLNNSFLPTQRVMDWVWLIIIGAFAVVFIASSLALCAAALWMSDTSQVQMLLTVVTTVAGILAGFISGRASSRQTPS